MTLSSPSDTYEFLPLGTIGAIVHLLNEEESDAPAKVGFLTAFHVCDSDDIKQYGTVLRCATENDIAVVLLDNWVAEGNLALNLVHFANWEMHEGEPLERYSTCSLSSSYDSIFDTDLSPDICATAMVGGHPQLCPGDDVSSSFDFMSVRFEIITLYYIPLVGV